MPSMNRVHLAGNLTRDPESRTFEEGTTVTNLGLAINEYHKNKDGVKIESTCFVDIAVWGAQAEACKRYLKRGAPVLIEGRLQYDSWENESGAKRHRLKVKADRVQFLNKPEKPTASRAIETS